MKLLHMTGRRSIIVFLLLFVALAAQAQKPFKVLVLKWHDEINEQSERYLELGLKEATEQKADLIIIDLNTFGGALHNAEHMRTMLLDCKIPVSVWINKNATSAGALISIACDNIYMETGSDIGSASVVNEFGVPYSDKHQSKMRAMMRATAETNNRNPAIAESFVGRQVGPDSTNIGEVQALTTDEAIAVGYCDGKAHSVDDILKIKNITKSEVTYFEISATEKIIGFLLQPWLRGILILLIFGGLIMEMKSPGLGLPIIVSVTATAMYFIPPYLNGLAQNWEILVFLAGIILLLLEAFVIPGFGVAGVAGIILTFSGLILVTLNNDMFDFSFVSNDEIIQSSFITLASIAVSIVFLLLASRYIIRSKFFKRVSLQATMGSGSGFTINQESTSMIGLTGEAYTVLKPSGKVMVDGKIYEASSGGEYIEKGQRIEVTGESINNLKVQRIVPGE